MTAPLDQAAAAGDDSAFSRPLEAIAWTLAALYAVVGLATMALAPKVPYADAWRFLGHFLQAGFPRDVMMPDNGHHELLPNVVRVAELHGFAAGQWLQIAVGMTLLLATAGVLWRSVRRIADVRLRAAAMLVVALGLFWLGNVRTLGHGNETVHAYFVTLFMACGLSALSRHDAGMSAMHRALLAAVCGLAAAFSFGSGIACFVAFVSLLALRRAPWREWAVLAAGLFATILLLHLDGGPGPTLEIAPIAQLEHLLRWLAGPFVYAGWPAFDMALTAQIPVTAIRMPVEAAAHVYASAAGPVMLARWPHLLIGACGLAWLAFATWRIRRRPAPAAPMGVGMAWFACAVGAMIALLRFDYLQIHPDQLLAPRYVVWSSLFWAGLGLATIAQARRPRLALVVSVCIALLLLPSELWMHRLGAGMERIAGQTALAAAVGVLEPDLERGETVPDELAAALPHLRRVRAAVFAWPETQWLGRRLPETDVAAVATSRVEVADVANRLGAPGRRVRFVSTARAPRYVLLVDDDGVVRGLAMRDAAGDDGEWLGWMRGGGADRAPPRIVSLPR